VVSGGGDWNLEEAQVSFSRDALDQSGRALPKIYLVPERKVSNRSRSDRIIAPSVALTRLNLGPSLCPFGSRSPLPHSRFQAAWRIFHVTTLHIYGQRTYITTFLFQSPISSSARVQGRLICQADLTLSPSAALVTPALAPARFGLSYRGSSIGRRVSSDSGLTNLHIALHTPAKHQLDRPTTS
jgi:hypothetical protein